MLSRSITTAAYRSEPAVGGAAVIARGSECGNRWSRLASDSMVAGTQGGSFGPQHQGMKRGKEAGGGFI